MTTNVGLLESSIQLASCGSKELLPMNPMLPADLFTSCLTTPIKTALLWYCYHKVGHISLVSGITPDMIDKLVFSFVNSGDDDGGGRLFPPCRVPGRLNDRRTPLGELNWIFTAITDTIAWNTMPRGTYVVILDSTRKAIPPPSCRSLPEAIQTRPFGCQFIS